MNILSTEQMKQLEQQLLKLPLTSTFQLKLPKLTQSRTVITRQTSILSPASQSTQLEIRKVVSLADNIRSLALSDSNAALKAFTIAVLSMIYQDRQRKIDVSDSLLLDSLKCSLYSPDILLNTIKGVPLNQSSNQMKALMASFFDFLTTNQANITLDVFKVAQLVLQDNQQLLICFIIFFRCILVALDVEGASSWKGNVNRRDCFSHLLDYFDISYRQVGDLFLLYEEGVFLSLKEKEVAFGDYFQNEGERQNEKKQNEIKSSIKFNMIESYLLNVNNDEAARKKKGIVDSDLKLFNFMLDSCQEEVKSHPDTETPHFKDNEAFHFGKKKKEEQPVTYRPEEVRFEFERLIKDESLQEIEPDDLINFNAQFEDAPSLGGDGQFNIKKEFDSPSSFDDRVNLTKLNPSHNNLITLPKNRMSLADQPAPSNLGTSLPQNRQKKASTDICVDQHAQSIGPNSNHKNLNINLNACFCRQIRMSRNNCFSKVVDFSFVPIVRRSSVSPQPIKNINFKNNGRSITQQKSYTLNKETRQKKSQIGQQRTPSFLKNLKKQSSPKQNDEQRQQIHPASAQQIGTSEKHSPNEQSNNRSSTILPLPNHSRPRQEALMKMKISDNQPTSSKKLEFFNSNRGIMGQSSTNWQTSSNFHQRHLTSVSPLNQTKSTFIGQPQTKSTSPLKFFAPVQIIAPTDYVNSNGNDANSNIVLKLSQLHQNNPKLIRGQHQSPFSSKFQQNSNQGLQPLL